MIISNDTDKSNMPTRFSQVSIGLIPVPVGMVLPQSLDQLFFD